MVHLVLCLNPVDQNDLMNDLQAMLCGKQPALSSNLSVKLQIEQQQQGGHGREDSKGMWPGLAMCELLAVVTAA